MAILFLCCILNNQINTDSIVVLPCDDYYLCVEVFTDAAKDVLIDAVQYLFWRCVQSYLTITQD